MNVEEIVAKKLDKLVTAVRLEMSGTISDFAFEGAYNDTLEALVKMISQSKTGRKTPAPSEEGQEWSSFSEAKERFIAP